MANVNRAQNRELQSATGAAGLRICLLGPISIEIDGTPVVIASKKARALLGYLVQREGADAARGVLTGLLWGERSENQARASLRQTLSELRGAFAKSAQQPIIANKEAVSWAPGSAWIDTKVLESAAGSEDGDALRDAAALIRGDFMEGLSVDEAAFEQWLAGERERFRLLACGIYARLMERAEHNGGLEEALNHGLKLISIDPLQEHVHRALMRLYAAQGRHDAALAQFERCKRELSTQLGVQPEPETEELARSIRTSRRSGPTKPQDAGGALPLPDKPSIAVLAFENMSSDPEQEYFADGMVEEIIMALSRMHWLFVIARNSSFTYKGRVVDVKQVGRELGVRYVLEGSVRRAANRVRISGHLIDTSTGTHLWADHFDGGTEDIFDLQDQVTARVVGAIAPKLEQAEIERARRKPTESMDAYDYFLRGMASYHRWTKDDNEEALQLFYRAIELDPNFASAYGMAARCYVQRKALGLLTGHKDEIAEAERLGRQAGALGKDDAVALWTGGFALAYVVGDLDTGNSFIDHALALNPNLTLAWTASGWVRVWLGEPESAIEREARAMRLSPQDTQIFSMQAATALAHFCAGRYVEALSWAEASVREQPNRVNLVGLVAASSALLGELTKAREALAQLHRIDPAFRISSLNNHYPFRRPEDCAQWADGLRKAGLQDEQYSQPSSQSNVGS